MLVYLDVSETNHNRLNSGIQRVVREVCKQLLSEHEQGTKFLLFVDHPALDSSFVSNNALDTLQLPETVESPAVRVRLLSYLSTIWMVLHKSPLQKFLQSRFAIRWSLRLAQKIRGQAAQMEISERPEVPDYFLAIDSFWSRGDHFKLTASSLKSSGAVIGLMIYDVIPLTHPEHVDELNALEFRRRLVDALHLVDEIFTISNFCAREIRRVLPNEVADKPITVVPLGVQNQIRAESKVSSQTNGRKTRILSVGTIEPRKNIDTILSWWLAFGHKDCELTIIGKPGWKTDDLQKRLKREHEKNRGFRWLGQVDEQVLSDELLSHDIGVAASFVEGFGLPVIEMSMAGLKVVASDIPIFREIAPKGTVFFDPLSPSSLQAAIQQVQSEAWSAPKVASWADAANVIRDRIRKSLA